MDAIWGILPWLITMAILVACSGFFSASEAALFSLRGGDRRLMVTGTYAEQVAERLLRNPDRLLSAVLFWNLVVNILYFAIASIVSVRLGSDPAVSFAVAVGSLILIIFFSEMLPKSLAVLSPRPLAARLSVPLSVAVTAVDPIMPVLQTVNLLSRRLIWPGLEKEPYLAIEDLERAIEMSSTDTTLIEQEKTVLANVVKLSELKVNEWMRPRTQFKAFRPPVPVADMKGELPPSGYLLITEPDGDEIAAAVDLQDLTDVQPDHVERQARPVVYLPWCATVADAFQQLQQKSSEVAAIVNEMGETIGIVTLMDIFDAILTSPSRSERIFNRPPLKQVDQSTWHVAGLTNVRHLADEFNVELPASRNITLGGIVQETLERFPETGDVCDWGPFHIKVLKADEDSEFLLELSLPPEEDAS